MAAEPPLRPVLQNLRDEDRARTAGEVMSSLSWEGAVPPDPAALTAGEFFGRLVWAGERTRKAPR